MNLQALTGFIVAHTAELIITILTWITYFYTLSCGFVSDDIQGIAEYDGKLQGWEYGMLWRWVRYHIVGGNFPSGKKQPDGKDIPQGKIPARHHFLSISVLNITALTTLYALTPVLGPKIALLSVLILIVHPCTTQGVAWISGLAYPLSLFWISLTMLLMQFFYAHESLNNAMWVIPAFCIIQFFAIHAIFATTAMVCVLLLFLGYWQFAVLGAIVSGAMCFDQIRKTISFRVEEFKKQHMEESTVFYPAKFVVAMKTFFYYLCFAIAPIKMGLYHTWGFHYDKSIERRNWMFWAGFFSFSLLLLLILNKVVPSSVQFGILWFIIFSIGFYNWITAQQFVTERYIMVANLGLGIVIASITQNYFWIYALILGIYLCKTWTFLPTYDNELRFYQSNTWNFPKSEVAMGNLGATYARIGLEDSAKDTWFQATLLNQDYDVPFVNIFYQFRSKGYLLINHGDFLGGLKKLQEGLPFLQKALACKICHFPEQWKKEYSDLAIQINNPALLLQDELKRLLNLRVNLRNELSRTMDLKRTQDIQSSINDACNQMDRLVSFFQSNNFKSTDPMPFNVYYSTKTMDNLTRR